MKLFYKINQLIRNYLLLVTALVVRTPARTRHVVPFISQFANPGWVEMVVRDNQPLNKDIMWPESGAKTIEEYEKWTLHICAIACAAMAIAFFRKKQFPVLKLTRDAVAAGVYTEDDGKISDMHQLPFVFWLKKFGINAHIFTKLTFRSLQLLLSRNYLIIAEVNPNISGDNMAPATQVGGHLILITGYNKEEKTITFHNSLGFENDQTQINHTMKLREFIIYFTGHGIGLKVTK